MRPQRLAHQKAPSDEVSDATGLPVAGSTEGRRELNESTETSNTSGSVKPRRLRLRVAVTEGD